MRDYWRDVPGFPGYQVSRRGEVWSLKRNRFLALVKGARGYMTVNLYHEGRVRGFLVHRLVAAAFLGPIPPNYQVNHKDGDKTNNELSNLEVVTAEENRQHALSHGLMRVGEANPKAKLTEADVKDIRKMRAEGIAVRHIAACYDVSERTIYLACKGRTWRHVD